MYFRVSGENPCVLSHPAQIMFFVGNSDTSLKSSVFLIAFLTGREYEMLVMCIFTDTVIQPVQTQSGSHMEVGHTKIINTTS